MGYWNSRGLRGSGFEDLINFSNEIYRQKNIALIQKIPTPITPIEVDNKKHTITLAYFEKQSTVDYIGAVQGIPICFDAKETAQKHLPLQNIHSHQMEFMEDFIKQRGVAFLLVNFSKINEIYFLPFEVLKKYWEQAQAGGKKSIPYNAFQQKYILDLKNGTINYLEAVNEYLKSKNNGTA